MRAAWKMLRKALWILAVAALALVVLRVLLFHGPVRAPEDLPVAEIVDLHCHVAGIGAGDSGCFVSPKLRASARFGAYLRSFGVGEEELAAQGDALVADRLAAAVRASRHVSKVVVLALDAFVDEDGVEQRDRTEVCVPDAFVRRCVAAHPELLYGASVHPHRADALERLREARAGGAVLVKWLPSIQGIDPAAERHDAYYRTLVELGLPLLVHTGDERSFTHAEDSLADPFRLRRALELGVRVIAAHAATTGQNDGVPNFDRLVEMLREFENLFVDLSALTQINRHAHLDRLLESEIPLDRILYGSDYPLIATPLVSPYYFPLHLEIERMQALRAIENPFDRDVELKQALGVPAEIFASTARFLGRTER